MTALVDLTHRISPNMPVYPGTEPPVITTDFTVAEDGFLERKITLYSHTGTHVDAPAHLVAGGRTLDRYPVDAFHGPALVLGGSESADGIIGVADVEPMLDALAQVDFCLVCTGWSRHWGTDRYFADYPVLSVEAAEALAGSGLKGIGFDAMSPDPIASTDFPVHKALMHAEMLIVENLTGLERLPRGVFTFSCFPLAFEDADGSPVRAVASLPPA